MKLGRQRMKNKEWKYSYGMIYKMNNRKKRTKIATKIMVERNRNEEKMQTF